MTLIVVFVVVFKNVIFLFYVTTSNK